MAHKPETTTLRDATLRLLQNRSRMLTIQMIAEQTGLTTDFLNQFGAGNRPNASVNKVQTLYEYLTGNALMVDADDKS